MNGNKRLGADRGDRLAAALRANLKRRKDAARATKPLESLEDQAHAGMPEDTAAAAGTPRADATPAPPGERGTGAPERPADDRGTAPDAPANRPETP